MLLELKYAIRSLMKAPAFTSIAILTLALGIGSSIAIFSLVDTVLLRPLPYAQPDHLARIYTEFPPINLRRFGASRAEYVEIQRETRLWESIEAWKSLGVNLKGNNGTEPARIAASFVTGGMFKSLHAVPIMGRVITTQDSEVGAPLTAVLSHSLWQRAFNGERNILGRDILLNGRKFTIIGIMPEEFRFPIGETERSEIWLPLPIDLTQLDDPTTSNSHDLNLLGRLRPGMTLRQAQAELNAVAERASRDAKPHHFSPDFHTIAVHALHEELIRGVRPALQMLFGAVCFLLLIACVNVANLLLARTEARQQEIAIRSALGAKSWQVARQFFIEGFLLAFAASVLGLLLTQYGVHLIKTIAAANIPQAADIQIDGRITLFTLAMAVLTGLVAGLVPLIHIFKQNLHGRMKAAAPSTTGTISTQRFRQLLIVGQLALAMVLLMGTGLMLRAFWKLQNVDLGFSPQNIVTMAVTLPENLYSPKAARDFWTQIEDRLTQLPGTQGAAFTTALPPLQETNNSPVQLEDYVPEPGKPSKISDYYQVVSEKYFKTLHIRLTRGRLFDARDEAMAAPVAIVNQTAARRFWGTAEPIGRRMRLLMSKDWYTVIGVVADSKNAGVENEVGAAIYLPYKQVASRESIVSFFPLSMYIVAHYARNPAAVISQVRREINGVDITLPLSSVRTMDEVMSQAESRPRFLTLILISFSSIALVLAVIGIYGVISYTVAQRTREFGLRLAIGASPRDMLSLVLTKGVLLTACGIVIGLIGSFAVTRLLSSFLFGVTATDATTFIVVSLLLSSIAILASYIPARRAMRVNPLVALQAQ